MTRILAATLLLVLAGCVAVAAVRPAAAAINTTPITAVETVGAAHNE